MNMTKGTITCPHCNTPEELEMPSDKCIPFAACSHCGKLIEAKGDGICCVFCKYGSAPCPIAAHHRKNE